MAHTRGKTGGAKANTCLPVNPNKHNVGDAQQVKEMQYLRACGFGTATAGDCGATGDGCAAGGTAGTASSAGTGAVVAGVAACTGASGA